LDYYSSGEYAEAEVELVFDRNLIGTRFGVS
jgi:hypothetical protein